MLDILVHLARDEGGVTAIEYGLIAALVSVAAVSALTALGSALDTMFTDVSQLVFSVARCVAVGSNCPK